MPRPTANSIDAIISHAIANIVASTVASIEKAIATQVSAEVARAPKLRTGRRGPPAPGRARRNAPRGEMTRWNADRRARRVPNFVIELTGGLDTKKKIVAKYGENAAFEKGKPAPATLAQLPKPEPEKAPAKAKPPVVRKAAAK